MTVENKQPSEESRLVLVPVVSGDGESVTMSVAAFRALRQAEVFERERADRAERTLHTIRSNARSIFLAYEIVDAHFQTKEKSNG